jgi:hypothetical protein
VFVNDYPRAIVVSRKLLNGAGGLKHVSAEHKNPIAPRLEACG